MTQAFLDARWLDPAGCKRRQSSFVELIDAARKRLTDNADLLEDTALE
jgi:hypothetical protein